jgi:hypothetical protein
MKTGICTTIASAVVLTLALAAIPAAHAQLGDVVKVNMPYAVSLGEKTLAPGDYEIRQLRDLGGGSRVLLIYSDSGMKFEAMAMTIPTLDQKTPEDTKVILSHIDNNYYFDKIWVQGKNYGYEFVLPKSVRERAAEMAKNTTGGSSTITTLPAKTVTETEPAKTETQVAAAAPVETQPAETQPAPVAEQPATVPAPVEASPTPAPVPDTSADRLATNEPATPAPTPERESLPSTSAGWLTMLLASGALFGIGIALRRKSIA